MKIDDVRRNAYSMPLTNPSFPPGPYRFFNREYFIITYKTDPEALAAVVPEPLEVAEPVVKYEFIRMPDSTGFGDYTETGQVIPVRFKGEVGAYTHAMYLDDEGPIAGGRELWGFPKKLARPKIEVESDVLVGSLHYGSVLCASATMGYKHRYVDHETVLKSMQVPNFILKIIPHVDGSARICELVRFQLEDITLKVGPGAPAQLTLTPASATNTVGATHCVTATVTDQFGTATPGITVRFSVTGSVSTSGSATTSASGQATFCYTGPALPGSDVITAFADTNNNSVNDAGEPSDTATKNWVVPPSTPACNVTYGGRILAANGDKATFGGNAMVPVSGPQGQEQYQDHGAAANLNVHSINVLAVTCSADGKSASIFGTATINGSGSVNYRIDMTDNGEPGAGSDTYRIRLSSGYDSGEQTLIGGNIQLH